MSAWNIANTASKKDIAQSKKATLVEFQEAIMNILVQQKQIGESLSRQMNAIQAT